MKTIFTVFASFRMFIVVVLGFILAVLFYIAIITFYFKSNENIVEIFALTTSILILAGIGIIDDYILLLSCSFR